MKARLAVCSSHLKDVEKRLSDFLASRQCHSEEKPILREALRFVEKAREAISEAEAKLDFLHKRRSSPSKAHAAHVLSARLSG